MAHWIYALSVIVGPAGFGVTVWRYGPKAFLSVVGGLTKDPQRSKQCERMYVLTRPDAKELLELLDQSPAGEQPVATTAATPKADSELPVAALETAPRPHAHAS